MPRCPRCGGNVVKDYVEPHGVCLQCGRPFSPEQGKAGDSSSYRDRLDGKWERQKWRRQKGSASDGVSSAG